jgi:Transglutaminase-like superfamily
LIRRAEVGVVDVARAGAALPVVVGLDVLLHVLGLRRTQRLLRAIVPLRARRAGLDPREDRWVAHVVRALDRAGQAYRPGEMCLRRALALWAFLRWQGVTSRIELGARRTETGLTGHAWVVWRGEPLHEPAGTVLEFSSFGSPPWIRRLR